MSHPSVYDEVVREIDAVTLAACLPSTIQYAEVSDTALTTSLASRKACASIPRLQTSSLNLSPKVECKYVVIYGNDVMEFRPDQWLHSEDYARALQGILWGLGFGATGCLGKEIANMEPFKAPLLFLRDFRVTSARPERRLGGYCVEGGIAHFTDMCVRVEWRVEDL